MVGLAAVLAGSRIGDVDGAPQADGLQPRNTMVASDARNAVGDFTVVSSPVLGAESSVV